jgi:hypothetical protein
MRRRRRRRMMMIMMIVVVMMMMMVMIENCITVRHIHYQDCSEYKELIFDVIYNVAITSIIQ